MFIFSIQCLNILFKITHLSMEGFVVKKVWVKVIIEFIVIESSLPPPHRLHSRQNNVSCFVDTIFLFSTRFWIKDFFLVIARDLRRFAVFSTSTKLFVLQNPGFLPCQINFVSKKWIFGLHSANEWNVCRGCLFASLELVSQLLLGKTKL